MWQIVAVSLWKCHTDTVEDIWPGVSESWGEREREGVKNPDQLGECRECRCGYPQDGWQEGKGKVVGKQEREVPLGSSCSSSASRYQNIFQWHMEWQS